jgi:hypothetical protein
VVWEVEMATASIGSVGWSGERDPDSGVGDLEIRITGHCVERWRRRFRGGLDLKSAEVELRRVIEHGVIVDAPPEWSGLAEPDSRTSYMVVGDDLVLVLLERGRDLVAKTCVSRGTISPWERQRREDRRRSRRQRGGGRSRNGRRAEPYRRDFRSEMALLFD